MFVGVTPGCDFKEVDKFLAKYGKKRVGVIRWFDEDGKEHWSVHFEDDD